MGGTGSQGFAPTTARLAGRSTTDLAAVAPATTLQVVGVVDGGLNVVI